jgi:putative ABC transport system permease protein
MLRNYFRSIWRNLFKNKLHTFLNVTGLSIGLTCCLLLVVYLHHELSYDKFQVNGNRIARVIMEYSAGGGEMNKGNYTSTKVLPAFKQNFPEVIGGVRMSSRTPVVKLDEKVFREKKFLYADSTFFSLFSFKLLQGQANEVLKAPKMVVLTHSTATKYFGDKNPVGQTLKIGSDETPFLITGVAEDCPDNSQIRFDFLASFSSLGQTQEDSYFNANFTTYLLLQDENSIASLQSKILPFMKKEVAAGGVEKYGKDTHISFELEPFQKIHLYSPYDGFEANGSITYIYIIGAITVFILLIACFTYINLSTARSVDRAKEVGVRKVIGAMQNQVFWQFIGESFFITTISLLLSFILAVLVLPFFNTLSGKHLLIAQLFQPTILLVAIAIVIFISLLAGSYPALILSKLQPVKVLKGAFKNTNSSVWLRRSLIVFQFVISAFLITSTLIIRNQLHFIQNKKLGYERDHVLVFNADQKMMEKEDLWKAELKSNSAIQSVSFSYETPIQIRGGYSMSTSNNDNDPSMSVTANPIDENYVKTTGLQIIAGSDLVKQDIIDASHDGDSIKNNYHFILNELAVAALGWRPAEAIGKKLYLGSQRPGEIKAVVKDFHFASLHSKIQPLVLFSGEWRNTIMAKVSGENLPQTIAFIEQKWKALAPHRPFEYHFMDEDFNNMYETEMRTGKVFTVFSSIAILLACLGLFGLVTFTVNQRAKEISIRKVLGASVFGISTLLSKDFLKLVVVAIVIAIPLAYYFANQWLQDFTYRTELSWWIFALSAGVSILIAYLTVSFQSTKAAIANPIKNLSSER